MLLASNHGGGADDKLYVEDVFSTYLYTGNGSTQTINNGIDLAGEGGLVWTKKRSGAYDHYLYDTLRGVNVSLCTNDTNPNGSGSNELTAFNSTGFDLGTSANVNGNTATYASWTFRKAPKFFDVVTWTGDGTGVSRNIAHALGITPGMIIVKRTSGTGGVSNGNWHVWHRTVNGGDAYGAINDTGQFTLGAKALFGDGTSYIAPTASQFTVGKSAFNYLGESYVAYLFAHDPSEEGIIQCGSFTTDGSGNATVNLGREPQWVLIKRYDGTVFWTIFDTMRGFSMITDEYLKPNVSDAASVVEDGRCKPSATGFTVDGNFSSGAGNWIYMAIRRPNKPPTTGTQVYNAIARTGTGAAYSQSGLGFSADMMFGRRRGSDTRFPFVDRLRGVSQALSSFGVAAEVSVSGLDLTAFLNNGFSWGNGIGYSNLNASGAPEITYWLRRAPGFMDVVCYTGTGTFPQIVKHNLGVQPELVISKGRNDATHGWLVGVKSLGTYPSLYLNGNNASGDVVYAVVFESTNATDLAVSNNGGINYVAYLFASLPGVSKVGGYTGNGSSQTINCGFSTGARFILIKRTDNTGDWYVWDSARGIVAANDPHLSLNTTAAEVTTDDSVDPDASGFIVNQNTATNINVNGGAYIFLAIS